MLAHLREKIGADAVVRSDDVQDNDVIGEAVADGCRYGFRVHFNDGGEVLSSETWEAT
jgi:hypothetical protein